MKVRLRLYVRCATMECGALPGRDTCVTQVSARMFSARLAKSSPNMSRQAVRPFYSTTTTQTWKDRRYVLMHVIPAENVTVGYGRRSFMIICTRIGNRQSGCAAILLAPTNLGWPEDPLAM
ncbi:hypothetical protein XH88_16850 [Bradyrhizobium sp. CCBAU 51627]|nr:hypothetical protein [Bradyrhizobium sp. CCBAU 51627]